MGRFSLTLFCLLLCAAPALAACPAPVGTTYTAVDLTVAEIQDCLDDAEAASGGTVILPAGAANIASKIIKTFTKDVTIQGAGTDNTTGTRLTSTLAGGRIFQITVNGTATVRIKDMRLISYTGANGDGVIGIWGPSPNKVLENIYFDASPNTSGRSVYFGAYGAGAQSAGLIWNCTFYKGAGGSLQAITTYGTEQGTYDYWDVGDPTFGSPTGVTFIEYNTFDYQLNYTDGSFDGGHGGKVVFRYNNVLGGMVNWHGLDSDPGSLHSAEVYRNRFTDSAGGTGITYLIRGGTAVIWGNTADSSYTTDMPLSLYRACGSYGVFGICQGATAYDGNGAVRGGVGGYPCYHQPGVTGTSGLTQWPIISWDNSVNGTQAEFSNNASQRNPTCGQTYDIDDYLKEGRDFINYNTCAVGALIGEATEDFCALWWDRTNSKGKLNGSAYTPYTAAGQCPHPLTGLTEGYCDTTAGKAGYHLTGATSTATHRGMSIGGGVSLK